MIVISRIFQNHILKFLLRSALLIIALWISVADRQQLDFQEMQKGARFLYAVWVILAAEMLCRLIPNKRIAMGARKHYSCSYRPAEAPGAQPVSELVLRQRKGAVLSAGAWIFGNAALFSILALLHLFAAETMVLLLLVYAVCDTICILFFCPFQIFFLKNRCCTVCRIYNWDCFMMCTPLIFFPSLFSVSLILLSLAVLLRWELAYRRNPRYFFEETNLNLSCHSCTDRLCNLRKPLGENGSSVRKPGALGVFADGKR